MGSVQTIVVVGRNNKVKQSDAIRQVVQRLGGRGCTIHWFESERSKSSSHINDVIRTRWPRLAADDPLRLPGHWRVLRFAVKSAMVLMDRNRRDFVQAALCSRPVMAARELGRFLDGLPFQRVHLITHSAGGITATKAAAHRKVDRIVCFGYPFRHPDLRAEPYRTAHLPYVRKPLLIVQGAADAYGSDPVCFGKFLPAGARIVTVNCDHDYSALSVAEFDRAWAEVSEFMAMTACGADRHGLCQSSSVR